jgi:hypothetical protein
MIVKLNSSHAELIRPLFKSNAVHEHYCNTYLSDLKNFHAWGSITDSIVTNFISYYEYCDDPAYYITKYVVTPQQESQILDTVLAVNESVGRLKFYVRTDIASIQNWSQVNRERYDYFDEYCVPSKNRCYYSVAWEVLFNRTLAEQDSIVRCYYLKSQYRNILPLGGNI